ncbi:hypothetical protein N1028_11555 [Herbiconiux sp. CPCC 203407]|uniref:Protein kinase domain-containing protein n=1 Tax=Herbiconiux oxytropis TaxID=2970915 RepID=A0AA42BTL5_9MICO|nr:hypothetical protein [Herbiconiux oxytropis]MCS5723443.1 hypothetical protein [Herbiconiux oxytropis]MCS5726530.1 hypothetical protein [Herbiconiux oxytropis]
MSSPSLGSAFRVVLEGDLGARGRIGGGAATEVERVEAFTVPGYHGGLAFVRVREGAAAHWHPEQVAKLAAWRAGLGRRERDVLDGVAAWPLAGVANEGGDVVGCLVPLAAHPFYFIATADDGEGAGVGKTARNARWLVSAPKRARRVGAGSVGERDLVARCTVLARVCVLLEMLHRSGIVFGDLSERSLLYSADDGDVARAFVVGCEGAAFERDRVLQRNSAGWAAPETLESSEGPDDDTADASRSRAPSVQTIASDRYKLGLLILRVLAPSGDGLERSRDADRVLGVLDEVGRLMLADALGGEPAKRPSAAEWYQYLRGVIVENLAPPVIRSVVVSPALVAEGDEVRLDVSLAGARRLTIELPGRADITREVGGRVVTERITARQSGRIAVRATNEHGETAALSNQVRVLPVPAPAQVAVAAPDVSGVLGAQGVLVDLEPLEAAVAISRETAGAGSPFEHVARARERLDADALPLHDVLRIGVEAERASREKLFPSFEEFLGDITSPKRRS